MVIGHLHFQNKLSRAGRIDNDDVHNIGLFFSEITICISKSCGVLVLVATNRRVLLSKRERDNMVTLGHYLIVSGILFAIGFAGVMLRRSLIIISCRLS